MNYFIPETYEGLLAIFQEIDEAEGSNLAATFQGYFDQNAYGFYVVTDLTAYTNWINGLLGDENADDFFAWDGFVQIKSTEGGGQL